MRLAPSNLVDRLEQAWEDERELYGDEAQAWRAFYRLFRNRWLFVSFWLWIEAFFMTATPYFLGRSLRAITNEESDETCYTWISLLIASGFL